MTHTLTVIVLACIFCIQCSPTNNISEIRINDNHLYFCADTLCNVIDQGHIDSIYNQMPHDMLYDKDEIVIFPITYKILMKDENGQNISRDEIIEATKQLNFAFLEAGIQFEIESVITIPNSYNLEDITENNYEKYSKLSDEHDEINSITIYLADDNDDYCITNNESISCRRLHGFTYILDPKFNNIVMSKRDINNLKVFPHEMGHFFGLYHTHRTNEGIEEIGRYDCEVTGDHLCSTPADPGPTYAIYVDYTRCEMIGYNDENGYEYKPMIENYMSYYSPCYLKPFSFTQEQNMIMHTAALSDIRNHLIIKSQNN